LIHAAIMPIALSRHQSQDQIAVPDDSAHHCDEAVTNNQDSDTLQSCHGDGYQCCLGLAVSPMPIIYLEPNFTGIFASQYSSLVPQLMIHFIYKPPKI
jgi:hypothetical protein